MIQWRQDMVKEQKKNKKWAYFYSQDRIANVKIQDNLKVFFMQVHHSFKKETPALKDFLKV